MDEEVARHDSQALQELSENSTYSDGIALQRIFEASESGVPSRYETTTRGAYYETEVINQGAYQPKYDRKNRIASSLRAADTAKHRRTKSKGGTMKRPAQLNLFPRQQEEHDSKGAEYKGDISTPTFGAGSPTLGAMSPTFGSSSQRDGFKLLPTPPMTPGSPSFVQSKLEVRPFGDDKIRLMSGDIELVIGGIMVQEEVPDGVSDLDLKIIQFFRQRVHQAVESKQWLTAESILHEFVAKLATVFQPEDQKITQTQVASWSVLLAGVQYERRDFDGAYRTLSLVQCEAPYLRTFLNYFRARLLLSRGTGLEAARNLCLNCIMEKQKNNRTATEATTLMAKILDAMGKKVEADFYRSMLTDQARAFREKMLTQKDCVEAKAAQSPRSPKSPRGWNILSPSQRPELFPQEDNLDCEINIGIERMSVADMAEIISTASSDPKKRNFTKRRPTTSFRTHVHPLTLNSRIASSTSTPSYPSFPTEKMIGDLLRPFNLKIRHLLCLDGSIIRVLGQEKDLHNACSTALKIGNEMLGLILLLDMSVQDLFKDEFEANALILAAKNNHLHILDMLLHDNRLEIDAMDGHNQTALFHASRNGHKQAVKALIESGADVNHICRHSGRVDSPLIAAVTADNYKVVELLLENGAGVNCAADSGRRALHAAVARKNSRMVKLLGEHGLGGGGFGLLP